MVNELICKTEIYDKNYSDLVDSEGYAALGSVIEDGVSELHKNTVQEVIEPTLRGDWQEVQKKAQDIIEMLNLFIEQNKHIIDLEKTSGINVVEKIRLIEEKQTKLDNHLLLTKILGLQNAIANFYGYEFKLAYSYIENGEIKIVHVEDNTMDSWTASGKTSANFIKNLLKDEKLNEMFKKQKQKYDKLNNTFEEVTHREKISLRRFHKTRGEGFFIFWQLYKTKGYKWAGYKVSNEGLLGEAYLNFYLHQDNLFNKELEHNVGRYMVVGVGEVDNLSGLLEGDFSVGKIQYVAKTNVASFMNYNTILNDYIYRIAAVSNESELENVINKINVELHQKAHKIAAPYNKKLKDASSRTINKVIREQLKIK